MNASGLHHPRRDEGQIEAAVGLPDPVGDQPGQIIIPILGESGPFGERMFAAEIVVDAADGDGLAGLIALYEFEGNAQDTSGNGLHGAVTKGQFVSSGTLDKGMSLQLTDSGFSDLGNPALLDFGSGDWTVSAWYKTDISGRADADKGTILAKGGDSGGGHRYALIMNETREGVVSLVCDDNRTKVLADATSITNDDEWHIVVGQREGRAIRIFTDGSREAASILPAGYDLSGTVQHNAYLGVITNNGDGSLYKTYEGLIDDVHLYNRALSVGELAWLAGRTVAFDKP